MTKDEIRTKIIKYIKDGNYDNLTFDSIFNHFKDSEPTQQELLNSAVLGFNTHKTNILTKQEKRDINEVIWDLIIKRVITPIKEDCGRHFIELDITDIDKLETIE